MKFIQVNDVHSSDKSPRYRTDTYTEDIFDKLQFVLRLAETEDCDFILFTGDLFHYPQASKVSHSLVNRWLEILKKSPCHIYIVPGNHDLASGRIESLQRQPIFALDSLVNVSVCSNATIDKFGMKLIAWNHGISADYIRSMVNTPVTILALHAPIMESQNPFFRTIQPEELGELAKIVCYGHIHTPSPIVNVDTTYFVNPGSLSRRSLGSSPLETSEDSRIPQIALVELVDDIASLQYISVPCRPSSEAYLYQTKEVAKTESAAVADFVNQLGGASIVGVSPEDLIEESKRLSPNKENLHDKIVDLILSVS